MSDVFEQEREQRRQIIAVRKMMEDMNILNLA